MSPFAIALVLASALLHAGWSASIKQSGDPLCFNLLQLPVLVVLFVLLLPWLPLSEVPSGVWWLLPATALAHTAYVYWLCRAFEHGDLSLVYPIARSTPALLPFVAVPLLGERISVGGAVGIAVVVAGVWLIQGVGRWTLRELSQPAALYAFLTLATTVAYSLIDKAAMTSFSDSGWSAATPVAFVYFLLLSLAYGSLFAPLVLWRRGFASLRTAARGSLRPATLASLVSLGSYTLVLQALTMAKVSYVVAVRQTSVLFAIALAAWWLGERPSGSRILGAIATVAGVALIALS